MKTRIIRTCKPIYYNLEKWNIKQSPLLLITGLSGSGKTTFASKFAKHHNAQCISFDVLKFYSQASKQSQRIMDAFLRKNPEIQKFVNISWDKTDRINSNDILFNYYCNAFFDFLVNYCQQYKIKMVLEGIQMFVRLHPSKSIGLPIIIIRSGSIKCIVNKFKRDHYSKPVAPNIKKIRALIHDTYVYHHKQRKILNTYITYLCITYNFFTKEVQNDR